MNTDSSSAMLSNGPVGDYSSSINTQQPKVSSIPLNHSFDRDIRLLIFNFVGELTITFHDLLFAKNVAQIFV